MSIKTCLSFYDHRVKNYTVQYTSSQPHSQACLCHLFLLQGKKRKKYYVTPLVALLLVKEQQRKKYSRGRPENEAKIWK